MTDRREHIDSLEGVIRGGFCVGCGACAAFSDKISIERDEFGTYKPHFQKGSLESDEEKRLGAICPFLDAGAHENELGSVFARGGLSPSSQLGWYKYLYAGHVSDPLLRSIGSSGAITTWLLTTLLRRGLVDAVIHVGETSSTPRFAYTISRTVNAVEQAAKTRYAPVEMSHVIDLVRNTPGRYAFVGVPCFVKALKRLALNDASLRESIVFTVGIFCGHLKSAYFAESLIAQTSGFANSVQDVDFRYKLPDRPASQYGFAYAPVGGNRVVSPMRELAGHDWGIGMFRLSACDYCDDIVGETADVSLGDAWLPKYVDDSAGTNLVIVRDEQLAALIDEARRFGELDLETVSHEEMVKSQDASFRHRRAGLSFRLWLLDQRRLWRPRKRVAASFTGTSFTTKLILLFRLYCSRKSHLVFQSARRLNDIKVYTKFYHRCAKMALVLRSVDQKYNKLARVLSRVVSGST